MHSDSVETFVKRAKQAQPEITIATLGEGRIDRIPKLAISGREVKDRRLEDRCERGTTLLREMLAQPDSREE